MVKVIRKSAVVAVHQANAVTGETPYWDAMTETLLWIDIQGQRLLGFRPADQSEICYNLPSMPGLLAGRRAGGFVLGLEDGLYDFRIETGLGERLVAIEENKPLNRLNDGKPDKAGRLWLGSMDKTGQFQPTGALYRVDVDRKVTCFRQPLRIPNGIDFSPDGTRMYFTDTHAGRVQEFDYDYVTGMPGNDREFLSVAAPVLPDGCCVDSEGALWIAMVGAGTIERRLADGSLHTVIELPVSRPTMPILGGPDGSTLFITSQRRLLDAKSLASEPFAGDLLAVRVEARARDVDCVAF